VAQLKDVEQKFATGALQVNVVSDDAKGGVQ
jgi:hypothetical protein